MEEEKKEENKISIDLDKINRIELINHAENHLEKGRILTLYENMGHFNKVEISIQDDNQTMKIFLSKK